MRSTNIIKNSVVGLITSIVSIVAVFVSRIIFTTYVDSVFLGYNALFTSVISVLSITELGVSTAISYRLYKPIADKNDEELRKLLSLFKRFYSIIAVTILFLGITISFFIHLFVKEGVNNTAQLQILFILFLINIVIGYLNTHKRSFLFALQSNRTVQTVDCIAKIAMVITQLFVLRVTRSYMAFLIINILFTIVSNLLISYFCDKKYSAGKISIFKVYDQELTTNVFKDIKNAFLIKVSAVAVQSTDSLIISTFVSNLLIGYYSNYQLVISAINTISLAIIEGITATIGDILNNENNVSYSVVKSFMFICFGIASFCSIELFTLLQKFIIIFFGAKFTIDMNIVALVIFAFFLQFLREPLWAMISLKGKFKFYSKLAITEALLNVVLSLILVQFYGFYGVLVATVICRIYGFFTQYYTCETNILGNQFRSWYIKNMTEYIGFTVILCLVMSFLSNKIFFEITFLGLIIEAIFIFIVYTIIFILCFRKKDEFLYLQNFVCSILKIKR